MSAARENLSTSSQCLSHNLVHPFAEGKFRWVADAVYNDGQRDGQKCVWKWFKTGSVFEADFFKYDILAIEKAIEIVDRFNQAGVTDKPIKVSKATVWTGITDAIKDQKFLVEPFIDHWKKFNSNTGWSSAEEPWDLIMQALSHFSYHDSDGSLVLCDLQGGILQDGAILSDPVIMSGNRSYGSERQIELRCDITEENPAVLSWSDPSCCHVHLYVSLSISVTDLGTQGMINFFTYHKCNNYCRSSWWAPKSQTGEKGFEPVQSTSMMRLGADAPHAPTQPTRRPMTQENNLLEFQSRKIIKMIMRRIQIGTNRDSPSIRMTPRYSCFNSCIALFVTQL